MADFNGASQHFLAWLQHSGAAVSNKIELRDLRANHAGRGVVASQNLEEDELLFRIPRSTVLSVENSILASEIPASTFELLGPWLSLILVMLYEYENASASNWAPYFSVLPTEFNTLMFWSDDELSQLQASAVVSKIGKAQADETFRTQLVPVIQEISHIFFSGDARASERAAAMNSPAYLELMHKMGTLIMSYAFDIEPAVNTKDVDEEGYASEDEDDALPKGMVPLADMLNADADRNNARLFYEEGHLCMKAILPIAAGDEIFNDYGPLPRSDLLRRYGYVTDNYAQYDVVEIPAELVTHYAKQFVTHDLEDRIAYADDLDLCDEGYDIDAGEPFDVQECFSPELLAFVQLLLLPAGEFEQFKSRGKVPKSKNLTPRDAEFLRGIVRARAEQYGTSLEQDVSEPIAVPAECGPMSKERRYAMAKSVRIGEKKILRAAEGALTALLEELSAGGGPGKRDRDEEEGASGKRQRMD